MTRLLTIDEAAEILNISVNTVRTLLPRLGAVDLRRGEGKNRTIRIPEDGIEAYLQGCTIPNPPRYVRILEPETPKKPFRLERRRA